jgi:hypothetical protein
MASDGHVAHRFLPVPKGAIAGHGDPDRQGPGSPTASWFSPPDRPEDPGGRPPGCGAQQIGREPGDNGEGFQDPGFGGGGFGGTGGGGRRAIDEETLKAVADVTGGEYYLAEDAQQLLEVFRQLPTDLFTTHEVAEISVVFTAIAALLICVAILLGQAWRPLLQHAP